MYQIGQQLDQSTRGALNKSTKMEREGRLETGSRLAAWRCDAAGPESGDAVIQKGRPAEGVAREEEGVEDR